MTVHQRSSFKAAKPGKGEGRANRHVYRGFHRRAQKLKINPIQKARLQEDKETESYFKSRYLFWKETNLSENFCDFVQNVDPYCDSLAQVLHHEEKVIDLLLRYISKNDALSLEPLLDLLANFAHDLGVRFEKHYARTISVITTLVCGYQDIEVVEWSFNTLTWLFQYLSKLLVPDLRPTYDILKPLLGKEAKKEHVVRFAAEAMSFLIRKVAKRSHRDFEALNLLAKHILQDWTEHHNQSSESEVYGYGLMTLFADTIKDAKETRAIRLHGAASYKVLLEQSLSCGDMAIVYGVTTSLIHHAEASTFTEVFTIIMDQISLCNTSSTTKTLEGLCGLLYIVIAVRKGTRVPTWSIVFSTFSNILASAASYVDSGPSMRSVITKTAAALIQTASYESLSSELQRLLAGLMGRRSLCDFPLFCLYAWEINRERFDEVLRPFMFQYMANYWDDGDIRVLFTAQTVVSAESLESQDLATSTRINFKHWPDQILTAFQDHPRGAKFAAYFNAHLDLARVLPGDATVTKKLHNLLEESINDDVLNANTKDPGRSRLLMGKGLRWYLYHALQVKKSPVLSWDKLFAARYDHGSMPIYIQNLIDYLDMRSDIQVSSDTSHSVLTQNLSTSSHQLRLASLQLLNKIYHQATGQPARSLSIAISIENILVDHSSVRTVSMHIEQLAQQYPTIVGHAWLGKSIIHYCFGVLTLRMTPVWNDAVQALKTIYNQGGDGAHLIEDLTFHWLETRQADLAIIPDEESTNPPQKVNDFQCTNAMTWEDLYSRYGSQLENAEIQLVRRFEAAHQQIQPVPSNSSAQAIRVLAGIPALAEKRSRRLVPLFLSWASIEEDSDATLLGDASSESASDGGRSAFDRREQKAMLDVFGLIQSSTTLYRANEVYDALLRLLSNGDLQIQKAALKAILTWKPPGVKRYAEQLNNLLDNARFREELVIFLPEQTEDNGVLSSQRLELMQVLLRLLYGRIIARGAAAAGRTSQSARRKAVFEALGNFPQADIAAFVNITLGPLAQLKRVNDSIVPDGDDQPFNFPIRKQIGFVKLAKDMLDCLGGKLEHMAEPIANAILYCLSQIRAAQTGPEVNESSNDVVTSMSSMQKVIKQSGLQSLAIMFKCMPQAMLHQYIPVVFSNVIRPRLGAKFVPENAQSVSSFLQLLAQWASHPHSAKHLLSDEDLLVNVVNLLGGTAEVDRTKQEVKIFVIESILKPLLVAQQGSGDSEWSVPSLVIEKMLLNTAYILQHGASRELASAVSLILVIAPITIGSSVPELADVLCSLLDMPNHAVRPPTKIEILTVLSACIRTLDRHDELFQRIYQTLSKLFSTFAADGRIQLCEAFSSLAMKMGGKFERAAALCSDLNAFSKNRVEEPDFDLRQQASEKISSESLDFGDLEWMPIVHIALLFIRDQEELVIRKGASQMLRRFIEENKAMDTSKDVTFPASKLLRGVVLPALRKGASERAELIRVEYLAVLAHLVECCPGWSEVRDLLPLLHAGEDGESFFDGILHIQQDWRKRSLNKLARVARQGNLSSTNIAHYFLPLIENFVFDQADDTDAHTLSAHAVTTIGVLASSLEWTQARKLLRHYTSIMRDKPELEKAVIRLIGVVVEAMFGATSSETSISTLKRTMPSQEQLSEDISQKLLPPLLSFLHHKDEAVVSLRVPVAVSSARLICMLPEEGLESKLAPVLTDVCNILRSAAQESRDLSRRTLAQIIALIGAKRFGFILKELRVALSRGRQLHVLSYTVHFLLVTSDFKPGDLDYCLPEIIRIVLDDTFGTIGQEKDAEGYTNKAVEVKSSKSMDTLERMARITTIGRLSDLINPVRHLLYERLDSRATAKVDELLRRIGSGLQQNDLIGSQETLVLCYEVLKQSQVTATTLRSDADKLTREEQQRVARFEIKIKGARKAPVVPKVSSQHYKLARFSLDLLRVVLHKHEHLRSPTNLSGFMNPVGEVLLEAQEEVQISALRLLASIMKVPIPQWPENAPVYAHTAYQIVQNQPDTNTETAQAAIKLISAILRDRPEVTVKETQVAFLVKAVIPDLTQPARQGVTFNFLKAVVARKIVITEVYQAMDAVGKLFVTYSDSTARNQARSIWLQFITTYEQTEKRFNKQLGFLADNLAYEHSQGRQSVMEAIYFLMGKLDEDHLQKVILVLFQPLVIRAFEDDTTACREMAQLLLKQSMKKANNGNLDKIRQGMQQGLDKPIQQIAALQLFRYFVDCDEERANRDLPMLQKRIEEILRNEDHAGTDWQLVYAVLQLTLTLCEIYPKDMFSARKALLFARAWTFSSFPHAHVKWAAAKLMQRYLQEFFHSTKTIANTVTNAGGMTLKSEQVCHVVREYFYSLWRHDIQDWLVVELVHNLEILDRFASDLPMISSEKDADEQADESEDELLGDSLEGISQGAIDEEAHESQYELVVAKPQMKLNKTVRDFYFGRICAIVRHNTSLPAKSSVIQLLDTMVRRLGSEKLRPSLIHILRSLNSYTDNAVTHSYEPDQASREMQEKMVDTSRQVMSTLQKKFPDGEFVKYMQIIRTEIRQKREERIAKRRIEAVADPERAAKEKYKKRVHRKERNKVKNAFHRGQRRGW